MAMGVGVEEEEWEEWEGWEGVWFDVRCEFGKCESLRNN
jgi:hypothetical protein